MEMMLAALIVLGIFGLVSGIRATRRGSCLFGGLL